MNDGYPPPPPHTHTRTLATTTAASVGCSLSSSAEHSSLSLSLTYYMRAAYSMHRTTCSAQLWSPELARLSLDSTGANPTDANHGNGRIAKRHWLSGRPALLSGEGLQRVTSILRPLAFPRLRAHRLQLRVRPILLCCHHVVPCCMLLTTASVTRRGMAGTRRGKYVGARGQVGPSTRAGLALLGLRLEAILPGGVVILNVRRASSSHSPAP